MKPGEWIGLALLGVLLLVTIGQKKIIAMIYPVLGKITSPFGNREHPVTGEIQFHNGVDFDGDTGELIKSPADGIVEAIYSNDVGGNQMLIKHNNGFTSGYAHLNKYLVKAGDQVTQGQYIAEIGATGQVTGSHLHFTMRDPGGNYVDPLKYLA